MEATFSHCTYPSNEFDIKNTGMREQTECMPGVCTNEERVSCAMPRLGKITSPKPYPISCDRTLGASLI